MPVVGFLSTSSADLWVDRLRAFRQGLGEIGYVEGKNVGIEYRWADNQHDRLPAMVADLVGRPVSVIAANGPAAEVAKKATTTVPVVFFSGLDPVQRGLVASLSRPGGNLTGVSVLATEVAPKRLQLLHEVIPTASTIALLVNGALAETLTNDMQAAARALGLQLQVLQAGSEREIETAFANLVQLQTRALVIGNDAFFSSRREQLAALTVRHAVPAIYEFREFAAAGGLLSYGSSDTDAYRSMGLYAGRILKGEKPADLPVQQATKFELIVNLKTAKALGIAVPLTLLGRADEVIE
jgi:putative ABC transport system substrate-binding protein